MQQRQEVDDSIGGTKRFFLRCPGTIDTRIFLFVSDLQKHHIKC